MSRVYTIVVAAVAATAQQDVVLIKGTSTVGFEIIDVQFGQSSDAGDAQSEQLHWSLKHMTATVTNGTGGSAATPAKTDTNDAAASITARINDTGRATTSGTTTIRGAWPMNVLGSGLIQVPIPEARTKVLPNESVVIGLETTPADSITLVGYVTVREF